MKSLTPAILAGLLVASLAGAQETAKPAKESPAPPATKTAPARNPKAAFGRMDSNGDGKVSLEEFLGKNTKNVDQRTARFKKLDKNGDGVLTPDELTAHNRKTAKKQARQNG